MALKNLFKTNLFLSQLNKVPFRFCNSDVKENIQKLVEKSKVVVFMKGVPEDPRCGFSNAVTQIMRMHGVQYDSYNVLEDEKLRQGMFFTFLYF